MTRKIALLSSTWLHDYTSFLLSGIQERIADEDIVLHVFNVYDFMEKTDVFKGEQEILYLADLNQYDGLLIAFTAIGSYPVLQEITRQFAATGKKVLCIDQPFGDQPYIGIDNYTAFYELAEHLITVHNCHTINFIGGPEDNEESRLRYKALRDCMKKHGLPFDSDRVVHCSFLSSDGRKTYKLWKSQGLHLPDAVLCANDSMALGYCMAAKNDGFEAPRDYIITGFDNIEEAERFSPSITSINRNWKQLGYESISNLLSMMDKSPIQPRYYMRGALKLNESCGCANCIQKTSQNITILYNQHNREGVYDMYNRDVLQRFCSANNINDFRSALSYAEKILDLPHLCLCLNHSKDRTSDFLSQKYTDNIQAFTQGYSEIIPRSQLLPNALVYLNAKIYFFSPLHFREKNFGYSVIPYIDGLLDFNRHRRFVENSALALETLTQRIMLSNANRRLKDLYIRDQLTGLYNRFGYSDKATLFFENHDKQVCLYYIDADNLKYINDHYGHTCGDKAITEIVNCMRTIFTESAILVRMGGDEFLVVDALCSDKDAAIKIQDFDQYLNIQTHTEQFPCPLSVSIGYIRNTDADVDLEELVHRADTAMYQKKLAKKQ